MPIRDFLRVLAAGLRGGSAQREGLVHTQCSFLTVLNGLFNQLQTITGIAQPRDQSQQDEENGAVQAVQPGSVCPDVFVEPGLVACGVIGAEIGTAKQEAFVDIPRMRLDVPGLLELVDYRIGEPRAGNR